MFRRWLSGFWRDYKEKIIQVAKVLGILILIATSASMIFTFNKSGSNIEEEPEKIYKPQEVAISGGEISKEKFEKENNLVEEFVKFCNEQKFEDAYNLLTEECKQKLYPTLQDFKNKYCNIIFDEKREYSLQGWITSRYYNTYKVNFTEDFMATGVYSGIEKYEDYITVVTDKKNSDNKKVNINNYIGTEELSKQTKTDIVEAEALYADTYLEYINCAIKVKNITDNEIVLDNLNNYEGIKLYTTNGIKYRIDGSDLRKFDLTIRPGQAKVIILQFRKQYGSDTVIKSINFANVITNYSKYLEDEANYNEYMEVTIRLR